jgi:hypothetical protein
MTGIETAMGIVGSAMAISWSFSSAAKSIWGKNKPMRNECIEMKGTVSDHSKLINKIRSTLEGIEVHLLYIREKLNAKR